jgi:thermostable 8-oxoguanine DNA glycosylase
MSDDELLDDIEDYWDMVERKQRLAETFLETPSREAFAELVDKKHFWATRARGSIDHYLDNLVFSGDQTPSVVANTIRETIDSGVAEPVTNLDGFGWATGTEILRAVDPEQFAILNTRSKVGLEALDYPAPNKNSASQSQYEEFVENVRDASRQYDLRGVIEDVTGKYLMSRRLSRGYVAGPV